MSGVSSSATLLVQPPAGTALPVRRSDARSEQRSVSAEVAPRILPPEETDRGSLPGRRPDPRLEAAPPEAASQRTQPGQPEEPPAFDTLATAPSPPESAKYDGNAAQQELSSRIAELVDRFEDVLRRIERFIGNGLSPGDAGGVRDLAAQLAAAATDSGELSQPQVRSPEESAVLAAVLQRASEVFDDLLLAAAVSAGTDAAPAPTSATGQARNRLTELNLVL